MPSSEASADERLWQKGQECRELLALQEDLRVALAQKDEELARLRAWRRARRGKRQRSKCHKPAEEDLALTNDSVKPPIYIEEETPPSDEEMQGLTLSGKVAAVAHPGDVAGDLAATSLKCELLMQENMQLVQARSDLEEQLQLQKASISKLLADLESCSARAEAAQTESYVTSKKLKRRTGQLEAALNAQHHLQSLCSAAHAEMEDTAGRRELELDLNKKLVRPKDHGFFGFCSAVRVLIGLSFLMNVLGTGFQLAHRQSAVCPLEMELRTGHTLFPEQARAELFHPLSFPPGEQGPDFASSGPHFGGAQLEIPAPLSDASETSTWSPFTKVSLAQCPAGKCESDSWTSEFAGLSPDECHRSFSLPAAEMLSSSGSNTTRSGTDTSRDDGEDEPYFKVDEGFVALVSLVLLMDHELIQPEHIRRQFRLLYRSL